MFILYFIIFVQWFDLKSEHFMSHIEITISQYFLYSQQAKIFFFESVRNLRKTKIYKK